ncbi:MAG: carbohydrate-binding protein [Bacteroidota bacterium]
MNKRCKSLGQVLVLILAIILLNPDVSAQGLKASGKKIVNENGTEVILRGMGLGGWMLQEPYMMEMSGFAGTQWQIKAKIKALIGQTNTDAFYDAWLANHLTRRDIDSLASWGFNSVRLPMHYNLFTLPIEDEPVSGVNTWLDKGFALTDSLVSWCKVNHIYVILDLHAAPGGQGKDAAISDYDASKPSLWESEANKQKTIALWRKLAERYANEKWVGGYDLLNEPNWSFTTGGNQNGCSETSNAPLRQLYVNITNAIRTVDTQHMIIVEGNCWGNNYSGLFPMWDNNMAVSFHKYWSYNDAGSISGIIGVRNQYNVPVWLGESGENSNVWFTDAISLVEKNGIGWAWWPLKKIGSVVGPMTIVKTANYQTLLDYWNNGGTAPTSGFAYYALLQMAQNSNIQNCVYHKDVIDAMFRQVNDSTSRPFVNGHIPGVVHASDYDLGRNGKAYFDTDVYNYQVTTGTYTAWNSGWSYRNDGVDIETTSDTDPGTNGYDVGWTADTEWLQYTANVDSSAAYTVKLRYACLGSASKVRISVNGADATGALSLPSSGGYQTWTNLVIHDFILYKGQQKIRLQFDKGGANFGFLGFSLEKKTEDVTTKATSAETYQQTELIYLNCNKMLVDSTVKADNFSCTVNGDAVSITSMMVNSANTCQVKISLGQQIFDIDDIRLSYSGLQVKATDGTLLQNFSNMQVKNNLPVYTLIPGKIEAESFSFNQGLVLETTTDAGGGQDLGYTNAGDYLDYRVRVMKTSKYYLEVRAASAGAAGKIEVQQLNSYGIVLNTVTVNMPVTGGWQVWKTVGASLDLTAGICTLRVKILQPEFNLNWFRFSETSQGVPDNTGSVFSIYPNPANDQVSINMPGTSGRKKTLSFRSSEGKLVKNISVAETEVSKQVFVGDLPRGLYIIELESDGTFYRNKLILR